MIRRGLKRVPVFGATTFISKEWGAPLLFLSQSSSGKSAAFSKASSRFRFNFTFSISFYVQLPVWTRWTGSYLLFLSAFMEQYIKYALRSFFRRCVYNQKTYCLMHAVFKARSIAPLGCLIRLSVSGCNNHIDQGCTTCNSIFCTTCKFQHKFCSIISIAFTKWNSKEDHRLYINPPKKNLISLTGDRK